jgi:Rrf2 family transcriptional regulator, iron-sulfur cluster assembly transcription factor
MLRLARTPDEVVAADRIANETGIPTRFARAILGDLQHAGLVQGVSGRRGGYRLAVDAARTSLLDVIEAIEGDSRRQTCVLRAAPCGQDGFCDVHGVFFEAQEQLLARLGAAALATLAGDNAAPALPAVPSGPPTSGPTAGIKDH